MKILKILKTTKAYTKFLVTYALVSPFIALLRLSQFVARNTSNPNTASIIRSRISIPLENSVILERFVDWGVRDLENLDR